VAGNLGGNRILAGAISATSNVTGDLTKIEASWSLAGGIAATSEMSGHLSQTAALIGAVEATSALSAHLTLHQVLAGSIEAQSALVANLSWLPLGAWPLAGNIESQATVIGNLGQYYNGDIYAVVDDESDMVWVDFDDGNYGADFGPLT